MSQAASERHASRTGKRRHTIIRMIAHGYAVRYDNGMRAVAAMLAGVLSLVLVDAAYAQLRGQTFVSGFQSPVGFVQDPTDRSVQFVVQQGGRIRVVRDGAILPPIFSTSRAASRRVASAACWASPSRQTTHPAGVSSSTSRIFPATRSSRAFVDPSNPMVADAGSRFDLYSAARSDSSISRFRITTEDTSRSGRTAISTSGSATADPATIPTTGRRTRTTCSEKCCASMSTCLTPTQPAIAFLRKSICRRTPRPG